MLVDAEFLRRHGVEVRVVSVEFAIGGKEIERLEVEGKRKGFRRLGESQTVFLADQSKNVLVAFVAVEIVEADAKDESDAGERGQSRVKLTVLEFGEKRGGQAGVAAEIDEAHFAAKA